MNASRWTSLGRISLLLVLVLFASRSEAQLISQTHVAAPLGWHGPDTVPPHVDTFRTCYTGFVHVSDSGLEPNGIDSESGINQIVVDSIYNLYYEPDIPSFIPGSDVDTTGYGWGPIDITKSGILIVSIFDLAGNETTVTSTYTPFGASIEPLSQDFGDWFVNQPKILFDTLYNFGRTSFPIGGISLKYGDRGFSLHDSTGGPLDLSEIPPGGHRLIEIEFQPSSLGMSTDTLLFNGTCTNESGGLSGAGITPDWSIDTATWRDVPFPGSVSEPITVHNTMSVPIHITSALADSSEFSIDPSTFPLLVAAGSTAQIEVSYTPVHSGAELTSLLHIQSSEAGERNTKLTVTNSASVAELNPRSSAPMLESFDGRTIQVVVPPDGTVPFRVEILNSIGEIVFSESMAGAGTFDPGALPRGMYLYRITTGAFSQTGKLLLGQ